MSDPYPVFLDGLEGRIRVNYIRISNPYLCVTILHFNETLFDCMDGFYFVKKNWTGFVDAFSSEGILYCTKPILTELCDHGDNDNFSIFICTLKSFDCIDWEFDNHR